MARRILRCALLSSDPGMHESLAALLRDPDEPAELTFALETPLGDLGPEEVLRLGHSGVEVVFVDLGTEKETGLELTRFLTAQEPDRPIILIGDTLESQLLLAGMRAGAFEYLAKPLEPGAVTQAVTRVRQRLGDDETAERQGGRTFGVISAKGGIGVTTLATNLAVQVARLANDKVALIDMDEMGTASLLLGLWPKYSFHDVLDNVHRLDSDLLQSLVEHHPSGVDLLSSPNEGMGVEPLQPDQARRLFRFFDQRYPFVVVDAGGDRAAALAVAEEVDELIVVAFPELPAIRNVKRIYPELERVRGDRPIRLVVNRYVPDDAISMEELAGTIGTSVFATLAKDDEALSHAANAGKPVVLNGSSRFSRDMKNLGQGLLGEKEKKAKSGIKGRLASFVRRN